MSLTPFVATLLHRSEKTPGCCSGRQDCNFQQSELKSAADDLVPGLDLEMSEVEVLAWALGSSTASILRSRLEMQDL